MMTDRNENGTMNLISDWHMDERLCHNERINEIFDWMMDA